MLPLFNFRVSKSGAIMGLAALLAMGGAFGLAGPIFLASTLGRLFAAVWLAMAVLAGAAYVQVLRRSRRRIRYAAGGRLAPFAKRDQRTKSYPRARRLARG